MQSWDLDLCMGSKDGWMSMIVGSIGYGNMKSFFDIILITDLN